MSMTLLQLIDQVSGELGLLQPAVVVGSGTNQTMQLLALTQRLGRDLIREFEWSMLTYPYIFQTSAGVTFTGTTVSGSSVITGIADTNGWAVGDVITGTGIPAYAEIRSLDSSAQITITQPASASGTVSLVKAKQDYALPSDFDRMVPDSNWDRTNHWRNIGTKSSQAWQTLQGGLISTGPRERYRIFNGHLRIFPALTAVYTLGFEYVSNAWVTAAGMNTAGELRNAIASFLHDNDTCVFTDDLMLAGIKYYFLKAKKLDFGAEMAEFSEILSMRKAQDVPLPAASLAPQDIPMLVGPWSVQDGSWPTT